MLASTTSNIVLLPRTGPRPLVGTRMWLGAAGMFLLARLTPTSSYAVGVLQSLVLLVLGFGLIFAPAIGSHSAPRTSATTASPDCGTRGCRCLGLQ